MPSRKQDDGSPKLVREWELPAAATLGSSVRARGAMLEARARLPGTMRKAISVQGNSLVLTMPETAGRDFAVAAEIISSTIVGIEDMPVIPREIEDILSITTSERHRWLKDGRLRSAGTRTVKLRGRARQITFHVFDPRHVEDLLNNDMMSEWREDDLIAAAEKRQLAAAKRTLTRLRKSPSSSPAPTKTGLSEPTGLVGWEEFERDGPLR